MEETLMGIFDFFKKTDNTKPSDELINKVNLAKDEVHKVCLTKKPLSNLKAKVGLVLDYSGSMGWLYRNGTIQMVIEKILPLAMNFDDDETMECWIFSDSFHRLSDINLNNLSGYIDRETKNYQMCGTQYAPVMKDAIGTYKKSKIPAYVLFITDGDASDKEETTNIIKFASDKPIFWQFVGIGNAQFNFLEKLDDMTDRYVDNADFFKINDINNITYSDILNEFPNWLELDMVKEMLK
jgi:hypothetical protein